MGEAMDSNAKGASFVDAHDVSSYKDVIKRLKDELKKIKSENEQLRETVIAYTLKLPQVSRKLNALVTCFEAKVYKFNRRKKRTSNSEVSDSQSCMDSNIQEDDDEAGEELKDEGSDTEACVAAIPSANKTLPPAQNYVEVVCDEENSPGNAVIKHYTVTDKKEYSAENGSNPFPTITGPEIKKSIKVKGANPSPVKNLRVCIVKEVVKRKKSNDCKTLKKDVEENTSNASRDPEKLVPEKTTSGDKENGNSETKVRREVSVGGSASVVSEAPGNGKRTKLRRLLQESASSGAAAQVIDSTVGASVNNVSGVRRGGRRRSYDCEVCGRTFARSSNLAHHVMRHRNERPHRCTICDRAFVQKANLKVHLRSHTGERPFSCTECGRAFAQKNNALRHLRAHVRQRQLQEQKLVCPHCAKTFGRWPSYETHIRRAHSSSDLKKSGQVAHSSGENMANDSRVGEVGVRELCSGSSHGVVSIPQQVENNMANSQLSVDARLENVHPSTMNITNIHANNNINNGPLPPNHHLQISHDAVVSQASHMTQINVAHRCPDT